MSFADKYKTHAFYDLIAEAEKQGIALGVERERERILKIIADYRHKPTFGYANLISLIKGEQK